MSITGIHHAYYLVGFTKASDKDLKWITGGHDSCYFPSSVDDYQLGFSYCEMDFDQRLWQTKMYPHLVDFITNDLIPNLTSEERGNHERKVAELMSLCLHDDYKVVPWCY
jgi:hypothetical protein